MRSLGEAPEKLASKPSAHIQTVSWQLYMGAVALLACTLFIGAAGECKKRPPASPLDLNAATAAQLAQVPGIGPTTAQAIVRFREKSGPFRRVEDLLAIRGISRQKLERLKPYFFVISSRPTAR